MLNNLMTHRFGKKKFRKVSLQINSSYFNETLLQNSRNKTRLQYEPDNLDVN